MLKETEGCNPQWINIGHKIQNRDKQNKTTQKAKR